MKARIGLIAAATGIVALGACTEPYGQGGTGVSIPGQNRTQQGAVAGAVLGTIYGATRDSDSNNRGRDAARGAIVGGLVGGLGGAALDAQARTLQNQITTPGVNVTNTGNSLNVTLPEGVLFGFDSATVSGAARGDLLAVARNLQQYPNSTVQVIGHTDSRGTDAYNFDLSQRRAQAVGAILQQGGVSATRIAAIGRGKTQPVASNNTDAGRAQNRRVEIIITPTGR